MKAQKAQRSVPSLGNKRPIREALLQGEAQGGLHNVPRYLDHRKLCGPHLDGALDRCLECGSDSAGEGLGEEGSLQ